MVARILIVVVVIGLVWGSVTAFDSLPDDNDIDWWPVMLAALVATPVGVGLLAYEFRLSAAAIGQDQSWGRSARISIYGTAANLLPIPGASLIRIDALRRAGATYSRATLTTLSVGLVWLGASLWMASGISVAGSPGLSAVFFAAGAVPLAGALRVFGRIGASTGVALRILAVQVGLVSIQAARLYIAIAALGEDATLSRAFALGVSVTVAAAAGFLPGGLGLRELIATALGPLVGLTTSEAFLVSVLDRVSGLGAMAVAAVVILIATRGHANRLVDHDLSADDGPSTDLGSAS